MKIAKPLLMIVSALLLPGSGNASCCKRSDSVTASGQTIPEDDDDERRLDFNANASKSSICPAAFPWARGPKPKSRVSDGLSGDCLYRERDERYPGGSYFIVVDTDAGDASTTSVVYLCCEFSVRGSGISPVLQECPDDEASAN